MQRAQHESRKAEALSPELQAALQRYREVNKDIKLGVIKNERGEQVGQQLLMRDEMVESLTLSWLSPKRTLAEKCLPRFSGQLTLSTIACA